MKYAAVRHLDPLEGISEITYVRPLCLKELLSWNVKRIH